MMTNGLLVVRKRVLWNETLRMQGRKLQLATTDESLSFCCFSSVGLKQDIVHKLMGDVWFLYKSFFVPTIAREIINHYICGKPRLDTWGSKLYSSRGDKPKGCKQHSSGKLKFPSSQPTLMLRVGVAKYSNKFDIISLAYSYLCNMVAKNHYPREEKLLSSRG